MGMPRVFVSHSHRDDKFTAQFVQDLRQAGVQVWVDVADLNEGNFMQRINEALNNCEWLVLVQTPDALRSPAVRTEVDAAIGLVWRGRMRGVIPFIAGPSDPNEVPPTWAVLHYYDATRDYAGALAGLLKALAAGTTLPMAQPIAPPPVLSSLPLASSPLPGTDTPDIVPESLRSLGFEGRTINNVKVIIPPMCDVPAGPFWMGSDPEVDKAAQKDEAPQSEVNVAAFQIAKFPVTVAEYALYVAAQRPYVSDQWTRAWNRQNNNLDHPVTAVQWFRAFEYGKWLQALTGQIWRLPTEAKWEKAARGTDKRIYPWGNQWDETRANTVEIGADDTMPVGAFPGGASPYGVRGMVGNTWEWCSSIYRPYPYSESDGREDVNNRAISTVGRVVRGGSYKSAASEVRVAKRMNLSQSATELNDNDFALGRNGYLGAVGFRLMRAITT